MKTRRFSTERFGAISNQPLADARGSSLDSQGLMGLLIQGRGNDGLFQIFRAHGYYLF